MSIADLDSPPALSDSRAARARRPSSIVETRVAYRDPFDWEALIGFLSRRAIDAVETFSVDGYQRGSVRIVRDAAASAFIVSVPTTSKTALPDAASRVRNLFDTEADPRAIAAHLRKDPRFRPALRRHRGIRVPGAWDAFEVAVRAIVGQQVSVAGATTTLRRIVFEHGDGGFPAPARLAAANITGMPKQRAETIRRLSAAVASGDLILDRSPSLEDSIASLTAIRGIGPWTAHYIAMRALREPDAFPSGDLILQRAAGASSDRQLLGMAEAWRPWRAYATMLLWTMAAEKEGQ